MIRFKRSYTLFFILFTIISLIYLNPNTKEAALHFDTDRKQTNSSTLSKKTIVENDKVITLYEDAEGNLAYADDLRYAFKTITRSASGEIEEYFDETGKPARNSSGYYGIQREYNNKGECCQITYLGKEHEIIVTVEGYAKIKRIYDETGRNIIDLYYDEYGKSICTSLYGYGKKYEYYDNGQIRKITFLDQSGVPMITNLGYSSVVRHYYSNSFQNEFVEYEYYYDEHDLPVACHLGEYGVHKVYDDYGNAIEITYLDKDGLPIVTDAGYTTIKRTFLPNNYIKSEQYYDINGNPFPLAEGQYGVRKDVPGQTIYLDQNGKTRLNIKSILNNYPRLVVLFAMIIIIMSSVLNRHMNTLLLLVYLICILYMTLLYREVGATAKQIGFFRPFKLIISIADTRAGVLKNIWLFIPLGTISYQLYPKKTSVFLIISFSVLIEIIQFFARVGYSDFYDIISNSIGGLIGYKTGSVYGNIRRIINHDKKGPGCRLYS